MPLSFTQPSEIFTLRENERRHIIRVLQLTGWRVSGERGAAKVLGINSQTLVSRMKKLEIKRPKGIYDIP